jgi:dihydroorotase
MNPPLRTAADVEVLRQGLKEGVIDAIATDHAPHTEADKDVEFDQAPFGVIGLETSLGVIATELVVKGKWSWKELVLRMSQRPAEILGIPAGSLSPGREADVIVVDPQNKWKVDPTEFRSKSKNSPFLGRELQGKVEMTICCGKVVWQE